MRRRLYRAPGVPLVLLLVAHVAHAAPDANRLTYLDDPSNPYYPHRTFPKLITPQWVGEDGVDAVVVLAIDDMRESAKYEAFLRPILDRLKKIDGRAPVSIMACKVDPADPQLQDWLKEGLSLECHTFDHPCPILKDGDFAKAKGTYDRCVDLLASIPNNRPVAFRTPCCDSRNTFSPRLLAEIINGKTPGGRFLTIDSSVFNVITPNDPDLPRDLVLDEQGRDRFRRYLPFPSFVNTIEDYPYPYVVGRLTWEFPCAVPSDWEAQNLRKNAHPETTADWKRVLDATVIKQGVMTTVLHPHGWSSPQQWVELIDHAESKYGKRVKFLTFKECQERIDRHLLAGHPLRSPAGADNGVRLIDVNDDGYMDVVIGNGRTGRTRIWMPETGGWAIVGFPTPLVTTSGTRTVDAGVRFGIAGKVGMAHAIVGRVGVRGGWRFDGNNWLPDDQLLAGLPPEFDTYASTGNGAVFRDVDGDGRHELIWLSAFQPRVYRYDETRLRWEKLPFDLPSPTMYRAECVRFVDVNEDGRLDVIHAADTKPSLHLFESMEAGWGKGIEIELPPIRRDDSSDNGFFVHSRHLWWQNEDTAHLPDLVDRRAFNDLLKNVEPTPKSPLASLESIRVRPGFKVELVAAEPLVQDPVAFAFGHDGKLWVVEMGDYPLGAGAPGKPGGRIKFLEDPDGDGRYDRATVFLDGLSFPTGVTPWRDGVLVCCAPDIFYAEDTDADGKADKREILFTGFGEGNQQHRLNGLVWGLDNWLYGANGDSGGKVKSVKTGKVVDIRGRDFRLRPDDGTFEPVSGQTQWGRSRDDWGNWFGGNNANPLWHYPLDERYTSRNPHAAYPPARVTVPEVPGAAPVFPISRTVDRFNAPGGANHFTSACSPAFYRDDLFGPALAGSVFVCEPVHNLVHREVVTPKGATFSSRRAEDERSSEFLASSDNWCRPVMVQTGPDGALWVADMYRHVIEHPQWIPKETQARLDLRAGHDMGRIYRVTPVGVKWRPMPRLDRMTTARLVDALASPNGWTRDAAHQLLLWRKDAAATHLLRPMASDGATPLARLHALCALDGLGALTPDLLRGALADAHPGVRRHAVRLAEPHLNREPPLAEAVMKLASDEDAQLRMQVAYSLGGCDDPRAAPALVRLFQRARDEPLLRAAVMSSAHRANLRPMLDAALSPADGQAFDVEMVAGLLRLGNALGDRDVVAVAVDKLAAPADGRYAAWHYEAMGAVLAALEAEGRSLASLAAGGDGPARAATAERAKALFAAARLAARDPSAEEARRVPAVRLLGRGVDQREEDVRTLIGLLDPSNPDACQAAAAQTLAGLGRDDAPRLLTAGWRGHSPRLRGVVLDALLARRAWVGPLLDAVERRQVPASDVDAARRQRLLGDKDDAVRARATRLFADVVDPDRQRAVDAFADATTLAGDAGRGAALFAKACATCHRLGAVGNAVGPDLAAVGDRSPEALLIAILDPNRAVEARYAAYALETKSGETITGVLADEGPGAVTLVGGDGQPRQVLRADIASLRGTGLSMMPEGLEAGMTPRDLADLIAHVRGAAGPPASARRTFDGNKPEVVMPVDRGVLRLLPSTAEVYGPSVRPEHDLGNLGWWVSPDDAAAWTVQPARAGRYAAWIDYACDDASAGNTFELRAGPGRVTGKVAGTTGWGAYRKVQVGEVELRGGRQRVTFRSAGKIDGALINLRAIELVPIAE